MSSQVDIVKEQVKRMEETMDKYSDFGAGDTEPDAVFQWQIRQKMEGMTRPLPRTTRAWQLYSGMRGVGLAAHALTIRLKAVLEAMDGVTVKELDELREFIDDYCWRC
jgi:hypothetical protein